MDRAQPGATGSLVHSIEAGESWGQVDDGWVVPSTQPTRSSQAASGIDETVLNAFDESHSATALTVTIDPGEAFVDGWLVRDTSTDIDLTPSTNDQTAYVGWDVSAVYSENEHTNRDAADTVIVGLAAAFDALDPKVPIWTFNTDSSGVTNVVDERLLSRHADRPAAHHNPATVSDPLTEDGAQGIELTLGDGVTVSGSELAAAVANGLSLDADGNIRVEAGGVTEDMLAFEAATDSELSSHAGDDSAHHTPPTGVDTGGVTSMSESAGVYTNPYDNAAVVEIEAQDIGAGRISIIVEDSSGRDMIRYSDTTDGTWGGTVIVGANASYRIAIYDGEVYNHQIRELVIR